MYELDLTGGVFMECLDYCLRCFNDVEKWEIVIATQYLVVHRCPYCHAVHTLYPDGTVRLQTREDL